METVILAALATVDDPELGVNIVDLGLVRRVSTADRHVAVELMMTTPTCPLGALMVENAKAALATRLGADWTVSVTLDRAAVWSPDLAKPDVRSRFEAPSLGLTSLVKSAFGKLMGAS